MLLPLNLWESEPGNQVLIVKPAASSMLGGARGLTSFILNVKTYSFLFAVPAYFALYAASLVCLHVVKRHSSLRSIKVIIKQRLLRGLQSWMINFFKRKNPLQPINYEYFAVPRADEFFESHSQRITGRIKRLIEPPCLSLTDANRYKIENFQFKDHHQLCLCSTMCQLIIIGNNWCIFLNQVGAISW